MSTISTQSYQFLKLKKITFDNLVRRSVENNISSNAGLVLSDESIVDDIKNKKNEFYVNV